MAQQLATSALGTSPGSYLYTLAVATDDQTYATIASDDSLTLFDLTLRPHGRAVGAHAGIACLAVFGNGFATAGRDGLVRCWDTRAKQHRGLELATPRGTGLAALATHEHIIAAGTESTKEGLADVDVLLYDTRNLRTPLRVYAESHTDTITQLQFHPAQPNILLSGSEDGLVSLFDVAHAEEEDALQQVLNPRSGVHCAGFLNPTTVYVVTADEQFLAYSLPENEAASGDEQSSSVLDIGDVRPLLDCAYVVDLLPSATAAGPLIAVGNHSKAKLQLVQLDSQRQFAFGAVLDFPGAHGEEIVRDVLVKEGKQRVLSCGEDGTVKVWGLGG